MLHRIWQPPISQKLVIELVKSHSSGFPKNWAKYVITGLPESPVQGAVLGRSRKARRNFLFDVDVLDIVIILVMPNVESYCGRGNSLAYKPAYTLQT